MIARGADLPTVVERGNEAVSGGSEEEGEEGKERCVYALKLFWRFLSESPYLHETLLQAAIWVCIH